MNSAGRTANSRFTSSAPVVGLRKSTDGQRSADHSGTARADRRGRFADLIVPTRPTDISLVMIDATGSTIYIETEFCSTARLQDRVGADGGISHAAVGDAGVRIGWSPCGGRCRCGARVVIVAKGVWRRSTRDGRPTRPTEGLVGRQRAGGHCSRLKQNSVSDSINCRAGAEGRESMTTEPALAHRSGMTTDVDSRPYYQAMGNEEAVFKAAFRQGLSLVLKGPTGCGKTRFVEAMAHDLGRPLITVACHDDLTTADLVGRYLLRGDETVWVDGPLTRAVREGAICYLDEVVEARQDTTVVLHPLGDHRRQLPIERLGVTLDAAPGFGLVVSYNPGYQSVLKDLKDSTRQRMVAIEFGYPSAEIEEGIVRHEAGVDSATATELVRFGQAIRRMETGGLREVASTRVLIAAGRLHAEGITLRDAARAAIAGALTDDAAVSRGLNEMIEVYLGESANPGGRSCAMDGATDSSVSLRER
jgi:nitric oxide reductase NorQ protein